MKKMLFLFMVFQIIFFGTNCSYAEQDSLKNLKAYFQIEGQASNSRISPEFQGIFSYNFSFFGFFSYFPEGNDFNQICLGPALFPFKWMCIGGGITLEQQIPGSFLSIRNEYFSFSGIYEKGVLRNRIPEIKTDWYRATCTVKINNWFDAGVMTQRFYGTGCRLEFGFGQKIEEELGLPIKIWCGVLNKNEFDNEKLNLNFLFGINIHFNSVNNEDY